MAESWPKRGKIEFCQATIGYSGDPAVPLLAAGAGAGEAVPLTPATTPVLRDITVTIQPGQKVSRRPTLTGALKVTGVTGGQGSSLRVTEGH